MALTIGTNARTDPSRALPTRSPRWYSGFRLGFWMAQQGSILVFVVLIFVYARRMERIERECGVDERDEEERP